MKTPAHVVAWVTLAALIDIVTPRPASASCNLVPSSERRFPSTLGAVTTPFASPGDVVTVLREGPVFDADPAANQISVRSKSPGGPVATASALAPSDEEGSACTSRDCVTGRCSCLRFAFPDAPAPGDGSPLTGPVTIEVQTGGTRTAVIDSLLTPASRFADPLLPCFLALPRPNRFEEFLGRAADVRAARDTGGTLFIPLDYAALITPGAISTRFIEVQVPGLADLPGIKLDSFTADGRQLPPLLRRVGEDDVLGTVDAPRSVLRVAPAGAGSPFDGPPGPVVIPAVAGFADPHKRADPFSLVQTGDFAVYQTPECVPMAPLECLDLNGDGDQTDYLVFFLDLHEPQAAPVVLDEFDTSRFPGFFDRVPDVLKRVDLLYTLAASDELITFRIPEVFDVDGNGLTGDVLRAGFADVTRGFTFPPSANFPRIHEEIAGGLLAASLVVVPPNPDVLFFYDADRDVGLQVVDDADHPFFFVPRTGSAALPLLPGRPIFPADFAVADGAPPAVPRIAFLTFEDQVVHRDNSVGEDLTGDGDTDDAALLLAEPTNEVVTNLHRAVLTAQLSLTSRWLVYSDAAAGAAGLFDLGRLEDGPRFICRDPDGVGAGLPSSTPSDSIVPCVLHEPGVGPFPPRDFNGDGDATDELLHVFLPDVGAHPPPEAGGAGMPARCDPLDDGLECDLALTLDTVLDPLVSGDMLVVPIDEGLQNADLDGDGQITPGTRVLHVFNAHTRKVINFGRRIVGPAGLFLRFIPGGLTFFSDVTRPDGRTDVTSTIFRDVDGDGSFEELFTDPVTKTERLADNCPLVPNPDQKDGNGNGIGDACELDDGNPCTVDSCDSMGRCVHLPCNAGTMCRPAAGGCDVAETCSGSSEECPPDALAPAGTPCDTDDDPCTVDRCDGGGACGFAENSTAETCGFCGDLVTEPCTVTVDSRRGTFGSLQKAVDAAPDGATLTVRGACSGPVKIVDREDLTLQGVPPPAGCPADGPQPRDLLSTLRGSRGGRPVLIVRESTNIVIRFLNIVDGDGSGLGLTDARGGVVSCNCLARNGDKGIALSEGRREEVSQNLVTENADEGIELDEKARRNAVRANRVQDNGRHGIEVEESRDNLIAGNAVRRNARNGIELDDADENQVIGNEVVGNGTDGSRDSGIAVEESDDSFIDGNTINGNADGLVDTIRCLSGEDNSGSNVAPECR